MSLLVRTPVRANMTRHDRLIEQAVRVALTSEHRKWKLGAILTRNSQFLGSSPNKFRNNPWINPLHATVHAEVAAIKKCLNGTRGSTVYVARVDRDGIPRLARPCNRCMNTMYLAGVREVVYTTNDGGYRIERVQDAPTDSTNKGVDTEAKEPVT